MASRNVLLGMVPVCTQTPPMVRLRSMTATFLRSLAAQIAAFWPAGPLPTTMRSYVLLLPVSARRDAVAGTSCVRVAMGCENESITDGSGMEADKLPTRPD